MIQEDGKSPKNPQDETKIDWGDDLLEKTAAKPLSGDDDLRPIDPKHIGENLDNAKILYQEGLFSDAKRVLRKVLRQDSLSAAAKTLLQEIQDREISDWLKKEIPNRIRKWKGTPRDEIEENLRKDLGIEQQNEDLLVQALGSYEAKSDFLGLIDEKLSDGSSDDRIALAIGFREIGLREEAIEILLPLHRADDLETRVSAICLTADSWVQLGKPFEGEILLRSLFHLTGISPVARATIHHGLGEVYEAMGRREMALHHYESAHRTIPHFKQSDRKILTLKND